MAWFGIAGAIPNRDAIRRLHSRGGPYQATLVRESRNSHDPNAVRVHIDGATVGYIPKEFASAFHAVAGQRVPAQIDWGDRGNLEVSIDVDL